MKIARPIAGSPIYTPSNRPVYRGGLGGDDTGSAPSVPGILVVADTFTDSPGTAVTAHTPDYNLAGTPWLITRWGATALTTFDIISGTTCRSNSDNWRGNTVYLAGLPSGFTCRMSMPDYAPSSYMQLYAEKIGTNGNSYARGLRIRGSTTSLAVTFGYGGTNSNGIAWWEAIEGNWRIDPGADTFFDITLVLDRATDIATVKIGDETRTFDMKSDTYTYFAAEADAYFGWASSCISGARAEIDGITAYKVG